MNNQAIYEALRDEIISGELGPGTPLREVALAARFSVSRTPIREVLRRLLHDGLLERAISGLQVATSSVERTIQVYEVRILLESQAAREAAESRSTSDLAVLRRLIERDRALVDPSIADRVKTNLEFHNAMWDASRNGVLRDILERLSMNGVSAPQTTLNDDDRWKRSLDQHTAMVDAIEARDADRAAEVATQHLSEARDIRLRVLTGLPPS